MKAPKKVIEKISLPLMFVTFVMAVLVFAVSPVLAQDNQLCAGLNFCDRDGDTYIRDHKKCRHCVPQTPLDCDDNVKDLSNDCENDVTPSTVYTAELFGAFRFNSPEVPEVIPYDSRNLDLVSVDDDQNAQMLRPSDSDGQATWDHLFSTGCPDLSPPSQSNGELYFSEFVSSAYNWSWEKPGGRRLVLRNIQLEDFYGVLWEIRVQLIGEAGVDPVDPFLPTDPSDPSSTTLIKGRLEGRTLDHDPGQRKSCAEKGDIDTLCQDLGASGKMEGFCLLDWNKNPSEMEIAILPLD